MPEIAQVTPLCTLSRSDRILETSVLVRLLVNAQLHLTCGVELATHKNNPKSGYLSVELGFTKPAL